MRIGLLGASTALCAAALSGFVGWHFAPAPDEAPGPALHRTCGDCPYLYELDPEHPEINSHGMRGVEIERAKAEGTTRILVLGDSVAYGLLVATEEAFPALLERGLSTPERPVEVLNAAVSGYGPFNELAYYPAKGRRFAPDLVVVVFVMNDVANPRLHWAYTREPLPAIPDDAIPNLDYDRGVVQPILASRDGLRRHLTRSGLENHGPLRVGSAPPHHITGEDTLGIEVLLDPQTPEWRWLRDHYIRLQREVAADGARFAIVWVPLAYQLDPDYLLLPQRLFGDYCREQSVACLDLLPVLRARPDQRLFFGRMGRLQDIWHLTPSGHRVTAAALEHFVRSERLLFPASSPASAAGPPAAPDPPH